jgi:3-deoxy-manno-octulosonate cytidylyltransferase (CMP-KDO synthetase)
VVATDDMRISDVVTGFGGEAVMTSAEHQSGSDRIAEAATLQGLDLDAIVVNVQGDEPDMPAALIRQVARTLHENPDASMSTASAKLDDESQVLDPSVVKVVVDRNQYAMYFSRATIPWVRDDGSSDISADASRFVLRHLGIYAYRVGYICEFARRSPCQLEDLEKLEQLRALWAGDRIKCVPAIESPGPGIDTLEDLQRIRKLYSG